MNPSHSNNLLNLPVPKPPPEAHKFQATHHTPSTMANQGHNIPTDQWGNPTGSVDRWGTLERFSCMGIYHQSIQHYGFVDYQYITRGMQIQFKHDYYAAEVEWYVNQMRGTDFDTGPQTEDWKARLFPGWKG